MMAFPIQCSDHSPLILNVNYMERCRIGLVRFEAMWLLDRTTDEIVKKVWSVSIQGSKAFQLMKHQHMTIRHLCNWSNLPNRSLAS